MFSSSASMTSQTPPNLEPWTKGWALLVSYMGKNPPTTNFKGGYGGIGDDEPKICRTKKYELRLIKKVEMNSLST